MRLFVAKRWWVALLVLASAAIIPASLGEDTRIPALVKQLGHDDFRAREAATEELKRIGEKALPAVVAACNGDDPEVRHRALGLFPRIMREAGKSKSLGLEMAPARGCGFLMGSPAGEAGRRADEEQRPVRVIRSFLVGVHEVTQDEYRRVMKSAPSWFAPGGGGKDKVAGLDTGRFPVEQVTWFDAVEFCNRLSALDGFEPYYKLAGEKREAGALVGATVTAAGGNGYRLPTEAEWELACRAGTDTAFHFGRRAATGREANLKTMLPGGYGAGQTVFLGRTAEVGGYVRNPWGLHDAHGNVAEWCWDWYDAGYPAAAPRDDPAGPAKGTHRVVRGGSWLVNNTSGRSAARGSQLPTEATYATGFRVARSPY